MTSNRIKQNRKADVNNSTKAAISSQKRCILFVKDERECRTAWFYDAGRARRALEIMTKRYGRAVIYLD